MMEDLAAEEYLRQRMDPKPGDPLYLHLSDLLLAISQLSPVNHARILDYGSGGSPYRALFEKSTYHRADLNGPDLDFNYAPDARLPIEVGGYDLVLSTQVLEHVEDPMIYLSECYRVLNPAGHLLLTTHGLFEDHGCPYDYWRWTVYGLTKMVERAGLQVTEVRKVTTGPRAALFLWEKHLWAFRYFKGLYGRIISLGVRAILRSGPSPLHRAADSCFLIAELSSSMKRDMITI